ncbi:MAG: MerR family transcriptional regulator [Actinobacteria bacterium]|nr:MerR family transcriptional regulator [Actinomycetota bacterium]
MRYRVDELAAKVGVRVDTVRFYQTKGLLPPPERDGRIAWYCEDHVDRLGRILDLKGKGFSLTSIKRLLSGDLDAADEALVNALAGGGGGHSGAAGAGLLSATELAGRTGLSPALVAILEDEGLLRPVERGGVTGYGPADVRALEAGIALLESGIPLEELLALARAHDGSMRGTAEHAVELFHNFVRAPIRESASSEVEAAQRLIDAFYAMLPAATALIGHHFRVVLLQAAQARLELDGDNSEMEAIRAKAEHGPLEATWRA